jgi:hypothetical protein
MFNSAVQQSLREAFEIGLRQKFGEPVGPVLSWGLDYYPQSDLTPDQLRQFLSIDAGVVVNAIVASKVMPATMNQIRTNTITCALLDDRAGLCRWATEGLNRCASQPAPWPATDLHWRWILDNPSQYIVYCRELKKFLNQL